MLHWVIYKPNTQTTLGNLTMYTKQLDNGTLNNYAIEPKITYQEYPTLYEQKRYLQQGAAGAFLVTALIFVSCIIS